MTGAPPAPGLVVVGPEPYDAPAAVALVADLAAEIEIRYADDVPEDGGDPEEAAAWAVRPEQVTPPVGVFLLARVDGRPVGCGALRPALDSTEGLVEVKRVSLIRRPYHRCGWLRIGQSAIVSGADIDASL